MSLRTLFNQARQMINLLSMMGIPSFKIASKGNQSYWDAYRGAPWDVSDVALVLGKYGIRVLAVSCDMPGNVDRIYVDRRYLYLAEYALLRATVPLRDQEDGKFFYAKNREYRREIPSQAKQWKNRTFFERREELFYKGGYMSRAGTEKIPAGLDYATASRELRRIKHFGKLF